MTDPLTYDKTPIEGPYGKAERLPDPAQFKRGQETVVQWLIDSPVWHPLWRGYLLCVVRLRDDQPGFPPPVHKFVGTTHELMIAALNPDHPQTIDALTRRMRDGKAVHYLTPINIAEQFIATDDEMIKLAWAGAWGVVFGYCNPETGDAPERIREDWLSSLTKSLAHIRGEAHAR